MQRSGAVSSLVLLKWSSSSPGTIGAPTAPTSVTPANYRTCTAPCMTVMALSGNPEQHELVALRRLHGGCPLRRRQHREAAPIHRRVPGHAGRGGCRPVARSGGRHDEHHVVAGLRRRQHGVHRKQRSQCRDRQQAPPRRYGDGCGHEQRVDWFGIHCEWRPGRPDSRYDLRQGLCLPGGLYDIGRGLARQRLWGWRRFDLQERVPVRDDVRRRKYRLERLRRLFEHCQRSQRGHELRHVSTMPTMRPGAPTGPVCVRKFDGICEPADAVEGHHSERHLFLAYCRTAPRER